MGTNTYNVHIPTKSQRQLIDTIAKYVSKYGSEFEREFTSRISTHNDLRYTFLLNEYTPENVYYKWRVYSLTQGDTHDTWRTDPYWIFTGGSKWIPPPIPALIEDNSKIENVENSFSAYGSRELSAQQNEIFLDKIAKVTSKRSSILDAMVFIIEHSESAIPITNALIDAIIQPDDISTKLYRLFLLSDVLHNTSCSKPLSWVYSSTFEKRLPEVFDHFSKLAYKSGKISKGLIIDNLYNLVKIWDSWSIYSADYIKSLHFTIASEPAKTIQPPELPAHLLNEELDGKQLKESHTLFKLPLRYRRSAYKYINWSIDKLKTACINIGLHRGGSREELLLRLASRESGGDDEPQPPVEVKPEISPTPPMATSIEIDRDFEESDMETMSDEE